MAARDRFWRFATLALVVGVFYVGTALHRLAAQNGVPALLPTAQAQTLIPSMTTEGTDLFITRSADGRTLYCWTSARWDKDNLQLPEFRGEVTVEP